MLEFKKSQRKGKCIGQVGKVCCSTCISVVGMSEGGDEWLTRAACRGLWADMAMVMSLSREL